MALVIVTRAEPGAGETAERLKELGHEPVTLPAISIVPHAIQPHWQPEDGETIIFTSANGIRAAAAAGWHSDRLAVCVGPATCAAAREAGFADILNADGNSDDIVNLIRRAFTPGDDVRFVHVANDAAAGDLVRRLNEMDYKARFIPLYQAVATPWEAVRSEWPDHLPDGSCILVHSAKGGDVVRSWLETGGIATETLCLVSISERAADKLSGFRWGVSVTAERPNEMKLMEALHLATNSGV